jgi:Fe-S-cluster containining protein
MKSVRSLAKQIEELLAAADEAARGYGDQVGLRCPEGCGACCQTPEIAATVLEMLPMAVALLGDGEAMLERIRERVECPVFEDFGGGKGRCGQYAKRPLVCRLFGYAGVADKHGLVQLAMCRVHREAGVEVDSGVRPPAFSEFGRRLAALAPEYGTRLMPIGKALEVALEKVMLLARLENEVTD